MARSISSPLSLSMRYHSVIFTALLLAFLQLSVFVTLASSSIATAAPTLIGAASGTQLSSSTPQTEANANTIASSSGHEHGQSTTSSPLAILSGGSTIEPVAGAETALESVSTAAPTPSTPSTTTTAATTTPEHDIIGSPGPDKREQEAILKALDWLKEKRAADYGWGNDTHVVILAKELSGARDPTDADGHLQVIQELEDTLSVKEMEIEILAMLDRHHTLPKPLNLEKLARYVLALGSLCKDPKHFHGHDLVATLQHHEPAQDNEFALATLSACSAAAHVRKRQIRRLLDIASGVTDQGVDTIAMVILALRCIVTDHRHRHLQHFVRRPARGLASLQDPRGSFGSLRSTALAMQALQDLEHDPAGSWNRTAASRWILGRQREDGGWTEEPLHDGQDPGIGVGLTADIILALGWKGLGAVRALQCDHVIRENSDPASENGEPKLAVPYGLTSSAEESDLKNVSYTYTLWVGSNVTEAFSLSLISPKNTSFFRAMTQAAEMDPRFTFEAREWPNGHYVHTLAGKKEEPRGYNYWLLYRLPELPDPNNAPGNQLIAPVGVDELMVEDGEHYLYWYKKL
ncbi:uncharacterized protein CG3556 isoform X3 [Rhagoletis pomonella]|nr:uncharacterized protein CG3556 isoform X3 [Rhagoletis pomonella]XP_036339315.1 uncharacterized protein CG3556 isoform X3 [Rhagoletis pomonella]XP_036339316.1 uncharacterized protein CG3556 isoform X3 [Rhagoletis pomonella]XP_036339317.1 uncharacterized protein CG3556 isoform X3 [Rhagoletis pomonella]